MIKPLLATLASATFTVLLAPPLHAADADVMRESADRAAIDALMGKYVRALDGYDPEGTQAAKGHEALQKMIAGFKERHEAQKAKGEPTPFMHHIITNPYVEFVEMIASLRTRANANSIWRYYRNACGRRPGIRLLFFKIPLVQPFQANRSVIADSDAKLNHEVGQLDAINQDDRGL
jgi:hypothetical protein